MISCLQEYNCVYWSTKIYNNNSNEVTPFENSHTVILKIQRRLNTKIQKFNNNGNYSYEIKPKTYKQDKCWAVDKKAGQSQWKDKYMQ